MTLRKKTLTIVGITLCGLMGILYSLSHSILLGGFERIEKNDVRRQVERASKVISNRVAKLETTANDYAAWDDTCEFIGRGHSSFIESNFVHSTFSELNFNFVLIFDHSGKRIFARGVDLITHEEIPIPPSLQNFLVSDGKLLQNTLKNVSASGVIGLPEGPLLLAVQPVVNSKGEGPVRGALAFARFLDVEEVSHLAGMIDLTLTLYPANDPLLPQDFREASKNFSGNADAIIRPISPKVIAGYFQVKDIFDQPCLLVRLETTRQITRYGQTMLLSYLCFLLGFGIVFGCIIVFFLEKSVLSKITRLREEAGKIDEDEHAASLPISGDDEVSDLAAQINRLLEAMETSKQELASQENRFQALIQNTNDVIFIVDRNYRIREVAPTVRKVLGYEPDEVTGHDIFQEMHPGDVPILRSVFLNVLDRPDTAYYDCRYRHADGSWIHLECTSRNLLTEPSICGVVVTCHDITDRKRIEEALRLDEQRLEALLALSQKSDASVEEITEFALEEGVRLTGSQFGYLAMVDDDEQRLTMHSWSKAAQAMCAVVQDRKEFRVAEAGFWAEAVRQRRPIIMNDYSADHQAKKGLPAGHIPLTRYLGVPVLDGGKIVALVGVANKNGDYVEADIRQLALLMDGMRRLIQRSRDEKQIRETQQAITTLMSNLPGMAFRCLHDPEWPMEYVSDGCLDLTGYPVDNLVGKHAVAYVNLIHPEDREQVWHDIAVALAEKKSYQITYRIRTAFGEIKWVREHGQGIYDAAGKVKTLEGFICDITDSRLVEEAIMASEANYRAIFDAVNDAIFVHDPETGEILDVNRKMLEMYGYNREEVVGLSLKQLSLEERPYTVAGRMEKIRQAVENGSQLFEWLTKKKNGEQFWCEVNLKRAIIGGKERLLAVVRDITERKEAEEQAFRETAKLSAMISSMEEGVVFFDAQNVIVEINDYFCRLIGEQRDVVLGKRLEDVQKGEEFDVILDRIWTLRENSKAEPVVLQRSMGETEVIMRLQPIYHGDRYEGVLLNVINVTELVQARKAAEKVSQDLIQQEDALQKIYAYQQKILSTAATAIFTVDTDERITSINESFTAITGYAENDVLGKSCTLLEGEPCTHYCGLFDPDRKERIVKKQCIIRAKDGRRLTVLKSADIVYDDAGKVMGGIESFVDVTELVKAREVAETANMAKGIFLANMSHEIRTPMNGILGMTELALDTELMPEQREYLEMVKTSADSLLNILNDVLDFSKIEAGKLDLVPINFNLRDSLCETVGTLGPRADAKGLELVCHVPPDVPDDLFGDPGRLRQIIVNLVGNAIKFTEKGEVVVHVDMESRTDDAVVLHFTVADTGIGIPPEKQKMIFDAFTQVDPSTTRKYDGTGLGLAISAQLAEMMHGRIWVESEVGKGSRFHFMIKLGLGKNPPIRPIPIDIEQLRDLPVLIVDDNRTNRHILDELLVRWGMKPEQAENGAAALDKMTQARDAERSFPLVLLDANMPEVDGFSVAQRIKNDPRLANATIMMLSSAGRRGDGARCEELGISAYLTKPIKQSELLQGIMMALGMQKMPKDQSRLVTRHLLRESRQHLRILLAEDNPVNQKLAVRMLEKWGHTVTVANNGREAVDREEKEPFDLVLMDVQMPVMGGFEATAMIREREKNTGRHLPIVAMTAHAMKGDRERTLQAGMDDYVSKPIKREVLFDAIEAVTAKFSKGSPAS